MLGIDNYYVVGCSVYCINEDLSVYGIWVTNSRTGSTELLFLQEDLFYLFTSLEKNISDDTALQCKSCSNFDCSVQISEDSLKILTNTIYGLEKSHRRSERYPLKMKADLVEISGHYLPKDTEITINDLSLGGVQCEADRDSISLNANDKIKIDFCKSLKNFPGLSIISTDETHTVIEGIIIWTMGNRFGVEISPENKNYGTLKIIVEEIINRVRA